MTERDSSKGELYIVSTPIGNLQDITLRALEVLKTADFIVCEDTRVTLKLLNRYGIRKPLLSYHSKSRDSAVRRIVNLAREGKALALVSDGGTPLISDPGGRLSQDLIRLGVKLVPVPGVSAVHTALAGSGFPVAEYSFVGFLSNKASRRKRKLTELREMRTVLVFFESPHRLQASLADTLEVFGDVQVCVAKEMTKKFEKYYRGRLSGAIEEIASDTVRGEYTVVIDNRL
jgi:16S rRNA (cytidine1402-2'-O)-methyltransferase